ncbi:hypothetical protein [Aneurinibacillus soli]|uniref:hypothetical protein n=1 Tax=Aneurinibacillus soli TaxID=1500254 RepID=UPI0011B76564|nr:hypothetical protein [Aneurinibacillus soli]
MNRWRGGGREDERSRSLHYAYSDVGTVRSVSPANSPAKKSLDVFFMEALRARARSPFSLR